MPARGGNNYITTVIAFLLHLCRNQNQLLDIKERTIANAKINLSIAF